MFKRPIGLTCIALVAGCTAASRPAAGPSLADGGPNFRWQIVQVPDRATVLLDTQTGRTWQASMNVNVPFGWSPMQRPEP